MSSLNLKDVLISLLPDGAVWAPEESAGRSETNSGNLDRTLEGMGDNYQDLYEYLRNLAFVREPLKTPFLSDLEKEYGILTNSALTEAERREFLHGVVYAPRSTGTHEYLQEQLQAAGFDVQVHPNSPAVDPAIFYGGAGGEMIVNNIFYDRTILDARRYQYLWSYIFFIGGDAIRNEDRSLAAIAPAGISDALKPAFRELVLKYKPQHAWGIAVINSDADYFTFATGEEADIDASMGFSNDAQTTGGYWWLQNLSDTYLVDATTFEFLVEDATLEYLVE